MDKQRISRRIRPSRPGAAAPEDARLRRHLALTRLALAWEALWPLLWPVPALVACFVGMALFDVLPVLPGWLHGAVLAAFLGAGMVALLRLRRFRLPNEAEVRHRLEKDSGLSHRPLQALADQLTAGADDAVSVALWKAQRQRLRQTVMRLSVRLPSPGLASRDPLGLRFAAPMLLLVALTGGWHDAGERMRRALTPHLGGVGGPSAVLQVWVTPPAYTGLAPILLQSLPPGQRLPLPAGSRLLAELQGGHGQAQLAVDEEIHPFEALGADSQRLEATITQGSRLTVRQGWRRVGSWPIAVVQDRPPSVAFASPPQPDTEGRLRLDLEAHDDYGVTKAWALIRRLDTPQADPLTVSLPLGGGHPTDVHQSTWHDLTGNPWAGLRVSIEPVAEDGAGQKGNGEPVTMVLPERRFTNPVARAIIEQRRHLAGAPDQRDPIISGLAAIASAPQTYAGDLTTFLALSTARSRLMHDGSAEAVPSVLDILWNTALRLEEGDKPAAQRALDEAAKDLQQALDQGASEAELERLMDRLQTAMDQYLDALAEQAQRQGGLPEAEADQQVISSDDLQNMLDQMRDLSRTGSRQAAQDMLAQLRQMLDGLRMGASGQGSSEQARQANQTMNELQAITRDQRSLLDQTFRRNQEHQSEMGLSGTEGMTAPREGGQQGMAGDNQQPGKGRLGAGGKDRQDPAAVQEGLRKRLGQAMQSLGDLGADIPNALGQAEQAMRESTDGLQNGDMDQAVDAQTEAVARLQEGARQAMQAMAKQDGSSFVRGPGSSGRDPLGRRLSGPGAIDENGVKIPDQSDVKKAREVLDELRKRSSQAERPPAEHDYLQRLLKQFF